jgi:peptidoglycan hydrolase-like protein with peptidoglycan-binding domain
VATAARNLSELGYLDVSDKALTGERTPALDQATRSVHKEQNRNNNANLSEDAAYGPQTQAAVIPAFRRLRDMQAAGLKPSMPAPQSVAKPEVPVAPNDLIAYALGEVSKPWLQSGPSAPDIGGSVQTASLATGETNAGLHGAPLVSEVRPNDLGYAPVEPVDPGVEVAIAPAAVLGALALAARAAAPTVVPPDKELLKRLPTILSRKGKYADEDTVFIPPVITSENLDNQLEPKPKEPKLAILPPDDEKEADGASKEDKVDQPSTEYAPKAWDLSHAIQREFFLDEFSRDVIGEAFDQRTRAAKKKHGGSRGDFFPTQHGNELAADECRKVLKRNYSDMSDRIDHIGGAYEDGKGIIYLKELQISDPNNYKDWGRPDLSWRVNDAEYAKRIGSPTAHLNTQTTRKSGKPTGAERFSLNRLQRLHLLQEGVTRAIVHGIPKMKKGQSDDEYRKIAEKGCEDIFADWLG